MVGRSSVGATSDKGDKGDKISSIGGLRLCSGLCLSTLSSSDGIVAGSDDADLVCRRVLATSLCSIEAILCLFAGFFSSFLTVFLSIFFSIFRGFVSDAGFVRSNHFDSVI